MIEVTEKAREKFRFFLGDKDPIVWGLRVKSKGGQFSFALEEFKVSSPSDQVIDSGGLKVITDKKTANLLEGAKIDFLDTGFASGFKVETPSRPLDSPGSDPSGQANPQLRRVQEVLDNEINPAIASHGGMARLVDVKENVVYLQFGGGCHGCGMVDVTLKQGIEVRIKEMIPEIVRVVDVSDHSQGANPYFRQ